MLDRLFSFFDRIGSERDKIIPNVARILGWICFVFALVYAIIAYRQFMSM